MILVDTSIWIDHIRERNARLVALLDGRSILVHPFVIGEIALGQLRPRATLLERLHEIPQTLVATNQEVLHLIERHKLFGAGIGYVDVHLLASVMLTENASLWTADIRLRAAAQKLGFAYLPSN